MTNTDFNRRRFLELAAGSFLGVTASNSFGALETKAISLRLQTPQNSSFISTWKEA
jgi:hypothetical protein